MTEVISKKLFIPEDQSEYLNLSFLVSEDFDILYKVK